MCLCPTDRSAIDQNIWEYGFSVIPKSLFWNTFFFMQNHKLNVKLVAFGH